MRHGDIWTVAADKAEAPLFRLPVEPKARNGLRTACRLMVDTVTAVPRTKAGAGVGGLDDEDILRLNPAMLVFRGQADAPKTRRVARRAVVFRVPAVKNRIFGLLSPGAMRTECLDRASAWAFCPTTLPSRLCAGRASAARPGTGFCLKWRATTDDDEYYVYAIALP